MRIEDLVTDQVWVSDPYVDEETDCPVYLTAIKTDEKTYAGRVTGSNGDEWFGKIWELGKPETITDWAYDYTGDTVTDAVSSFVELAQGKIKPVWEN